MNMILITNKLNKLMKIQMKVSIQMKMNNKQWKNYKKNMDRMVRHKMKKVVQITINIL